MILVSLVLSACAPKVRHVRAKPPAEIYNCKPTVMPEFVSLTNEQEAMLKSANIPSNIVAGLTREETKVLKRMMLEVEACFLTWREWSQ